jgi:murein DD-endopeptidase MepM/ murein hydrolase activator NlpD
VTGGAIAGFARVVLESDNRRLNTGLAKGERDVKGFAQRGATALGSFARAFAGLGAVGGTAGLVALLKSSVAAASDLNEELAKSRAIFGDSAGAIEVWSRSAAENLKISQREALSFSGAIGAMLKTTGLAVPEVAAMSQRLVQLGADMASFANEDPSAMLDRLRSGLAGEAEPLRRFGVLLSEAAVQQEAVRIGLVRQGEALTDAEKVQARYSLILRQTVDQQGDVARTGDQLAGQQRELRARLEDLQATLGQKLLPIQLKVVESLVDWTDELANNEQLQRDVRDAVEGVADVVRDSAELIDEIADLMGGWRDASQFIITGLLARQVLKLGAAFSVATFGAGVAGAAGAAGAARATGGIGGAAGQAGLLATRLNALALLGAIAIPIYLKIITDDSDVPDWVKTTPAWALFQGLDKVLPGGDDKKSAPKLDPTSVGAATRIFPIPAGVPFKRGGGAAAHGSRPLGNWQSDNAVDIMVEPGTPILAIGDGVVTKVSGSDPSRGASGTVFGYSVTIKLFRGGYRVFYTHLDDVTVKAGQRVGRGTVIGYAAAGTPGGAHLHFAVERGRPEDIYTAVHGRIRDTSTGAKVPDQGPAPAPTVEEGIPVRMQERLARAELTKGTADDLAALREVEAYLEKRIKLEKEQDRRIKLLRELKSVRSQIGQVGGRATPALASLIPPVLENKLARAELTKTLDDDLKALEAIEAYLVKKLAATKKLSDQTGVMRELRDVRRQMEGILGEVGSDKKAIDRLIGDIIAGTDQLVSGPNDRPATMFQPGTNFVEQITTKEGKADLTKLLASLEPQKQRIREWANEMDLKRKAAIERRKSLQAQLKKLRRTPPRLRTSRYRQAEANLLAAIADLTAVIKQLDDGISRAFEMWGDLEATETSETQRIAGEDEEHRSAPPDLGGGAGGGASGGDSFDAGGTPAPTTFSPQQVEAMRQEFLGARARIFGEFSPNVFTRGPLGLELGSAGLASSAGLGGVTVIQQFQTPPFDLHAYFLHAQFAAEHALGS